MLRYLNIQGIAGLVAGVTLVLLILVQKGETRHWKKRSGQFEQLYQREQAALTGTIANYRAAAEQARAADRANLQRVEAEQRAINDRSIHDLEKRLGDARARADELRRQAHLTAADPGSRGGSPVPRLPASAGGAAKVAGENRLPESRHRRQAEVAPLGVEDALIATEQAIQLDELIKWVRQQHAVRFDDLAR